MGVLARDQVAWQVNVIEWISNFYKTSPANCWPHVTRSNKCASTLADIETWTEMFVASSIRRRTSQRSHMSADVISVMFGPTSRRCIANSYDSTYHMFTLTVLSTRRLQQMYSNFTAQYLDNQFCFIFFLTATYYTLECLTLTYWNYSKYRMH